MPPRTTRSEYRRRQERARAEGWTNFAQQRYRTTPRSPGYLSSEHGTLARERMIALGAQIGGPPGPKRPNSLFSEATQSVVNSLTHHGGRPRHGDYRARLVNASPAAKRRARQRELRMLRRAGLPVGGL